MIHIALADATDMNLDKSPLARAGVKLKHRETFTGGSDLEEFEGFTANIFRWLKMNYLLGLTSIDLQVSYMGTCPTGEGQEWFHQNIECFNHQVCDWTLETVVQGLQKRFLHTLTYHHMLNKFDSARMVQEPMNELTKYAPHMIQQLDDYMLQQHFVSVLRDTLHNEVSKRATTQRQALWRHCETQPV
jgi:hypothetical protein